MLLTKGFEVELYTCTPAGEVIGLAVPISQALPEFGREPDQRNIEYTTPPLRNYGDLFEALMEPRLLLRRYLSLLGNYTLLPGSTFALGGSDRFERSDPNNPYHSYIEATYGAKAATTGIHINIGIPDVEDLLRVCRVIRMEAPLFLALSAASPFLDGMVTGWHSTRWNLFPETPAKVPLFVNHYEFIRWTEVQLRQGTMQNVRHLWLSVRPNGDRRPYSLNRLELRICDLVSDPVALLAITALLELRIHTILHNEALDPLTDSPYTPDELLAIARTNERMAARMSLQSTLIHWQTGQRISTQEWIWNLYESCKPAATPLGIDRYLHPLTEILEHGNEAQQWIAAYRYGLSPHQVMIAAIQDFAYQDLAYADRWAIAH